MSLVSNKIFSNSLINSSFDSASFSSVASAIGSAGSSGVAGATGSVGSAGVSSGAGSFHMLARTSSTLLDCAGDSCIGVSTASGNGGVDDDWPSNDSNTPQNISSNDAVFSRSVSLNFFLDVPIIFV